MPTKLEMPESDVSKLRRWFVTILISVLAVGIGHAFAAIWFTSALNQKVIQLERTITKLESTNEKLSILIHQNETRILKMENHLGPNKS